MNREKGGGGRCWRISWHFFRGLPGRWAIAPKSSCASPGMNDSARFSGWQTAAPVSHSHLLARVILQVMQRRHRAILGGKHVQFGNQYSEDGGNKSRRKWEPNVQTTRIYSDALEQYMRLRVSTYVLKRRDLTNLRMGGRPDKPPRAVHPPSPPQR